MGRADQRTYHYIYKITRTDGSGKYYIGMHSTDDLDDGYFGSGVILKRSVAKYGREQHCKTILEFHPSRARLREREKELVSEELVSDDLCMNLKIGGDGGNWNHTERSREKMRLAAANRTPDEKARIAERCKQPEWHAALVSAAKNKSAATRQKLSEARIGKITSLETKKKLAEAASKVRWTPEQKAKHSALQKERAARGGFVPNVAGKKVKSPDGTIFESKTAVMRSLAIGKKALNSLLKSQVGWVLLE